MMQLDDSKILCSPACSRCCFPRRCTRRFQFAFLNNVCTFIVETHWHIVSEKCCCLCGCRRKAGVNRSVVTPLTFCFISNLYQTSENITTTAFEQYFDTWATWLSSYGKTLWGYLLIQHQQVIIKMRRQALCVARAMRCSGVWNPQQRQKDHYLGGKKTPCRSVCVLRFHSSHRSSENIVKWKGSM